MGFGLVWARAFLLFFFSFLGYLVTCFGHWNYWIFLGFFVFFSVSSWSTCRFTQAMDAFWVWDGAGQLSSKSIPLNSTLHLPTCLIQQSHVLTTAVPSRALPDPS